MLLFSLSAAQAAATLAATVIGFQLGLFDSSVVNAVLVLILVSVLASTLTAIRASERIVSPDQGPQPLGTRVVVGVGDPDHARGALAVAVRIARADGGVVHPVLVVPESAPFAPRAARERLEQVVATAGVDGLPTTIVDRSVLHGALRAGAAQEATLVLVSESPEEVDFAAGQLSQRAAADASTHPRPVAVVHGNADRLGSVRTLLEDDGELASSVGAEMARRVAGGPAARVNEDDPDWRTSLGPGDVTFVSTRIGEALADLHEIDHGMIVATLADSAVAEQDVRDVRGFSA